jgi:pimeloyl-ACP methyl ester carboxylesterase
MKISFLLLLTLTLGTACNKKSASPQVEAEKSSSDSKTTNPVIVDNTPVQPDTRPFAATVSPVAFECDTLDYGIYWYGKGDVAQKVSSTTQSSFYDASKPTLIYVHGWQANSHIKKRRTTFNYKYTDPIFGVKSDAADAWIAAGWNVGIFYWNQIADDSDVVVVENRIWENAQLSWKNCTGFSETAGLPKSSVSSLLFNAYSEAMKGYKGNEIRLAGHSLGNQLVTNLAAAAHDAAKAGKIESNLVPKRVALLDPFWSAAAIAKASRASLVRSLIGPLKNDGMIFEWYKTSTLTEEDRGDENSELLSMIGRTDLELAYYSDKNQISRHVAAPFLYFLSFASPAPSGCKSPCTDKAPSAATSNERMFELMNKASEYVQITGARTPDVSDNTFELKAN